MIDVMVIVKNGHCSLCGEKAEERFTLVVRSKMKVSLRPSNAHAAACKPCLQALGREVYVEAGK